MRLTLLMKDGSTSTFQSRLSCLSFSVNSNIFIFVCRVENDHILVLFCHNFHKIFNDPQTRFQVRFKYNNMQMRIMHRYVFHLTQYANISKPMRIHYYINSNVL
jgi:hypothetical protein